MDYGSVIFLELNKLERLMLDCDSSTRDVLRQQYKDTLLFYVLRSCCSHKIMNPPVEFVTFT